MEQFHKVGRIANAKLYELYCDGEDVTETTFLYVYRFNQYSIRHLSHTYKNIIKNNSRSLIKINVIITYTPGKQESDIMNYSCYTLC